MVKEKRYKKDRHDLGQMFLWKEEEWTPGVSEKADRDQMVVDIFAALNNKEFSPIYKSGLTLKLIMQYGHKWRTHHRQNKDVPIDDDKNNRPIDDGKKDVPIDDGKKVDPIDEGIPIKAIKKMLSESL